MGTHQYNETDAWFLPSYYNAMGAAVYSSYFPLQMTGRVDDRQYAPTPSSGITLHTRRCRMMTNWIYLFMNINAEVFHDSAYFSSFQGGGGRGEGGKG